MRGTWKNNCHNHQLLKNLYTLLSSAISLFSLEDETFLKSFDGGPNQKTINGLKLLQQKLNI